MATHFNHVILYKKEVDYTENEFRLQGSECRQCPHLHILSPNTKTSVHTIHQIEPFSFLPLQLEKRMGWKMLRSQQVLDCRALTWFASFFYSFRVAGVVFFTNGSLQPTANTSYKMSDCYNSTCQVLRGSEVSGYVPSMHGNFISRASHERSIKTCRPPAVLDVNQGCTVSQKCSSQYSHV